MKENTLEFYNNNCNQYYESTVAVDLSHIYSKFINELEAKSSILDLGCGSGRDSLYFKSKGYTITAIDGSKNLAQLASKLIGQDVIVSKFEDLELKDKYNGIWACSSLLHLKHNELEKLLVKIEKALDTNGVLYMSFKYGTKEYIDDKGRYFNCYTEESISKLIEGSTVLKIREIFKTVDVIPGREEVAWLNVICLNSKVYK